MGNTDRDGKPEEDIREGDVGGGGQETLFELRKRSRKRRSFMDTDYTSRVSYPEHEPQSEKDPVYNRLHKTPLAEANDAQVLSSDPEPSEQTQNISPTVSSLTHSEGEPAQLESKPILSKYRPHAPGSPSGLGSQRDPPPSSRTRKQDMEMEPDAMESKSVTDLVRAASPTITVVRCRVDPDGKESSDRRGDGKEEGEGLQAAGDGNSDGQSGSVTHMFLQERDDKNERGSKGSKGCSTSSQRPLLGSEGQLEANTRPTCPVDLYKKASNGLVGAHLIAPEQNSNAEEGDSVPSSFSPPPPPPSSPLPPSPGLHNPQSNCVMKGGGGGQDLATLAKMSLSNFKDALFGKDDRTNKPQLYLEIARSDVNEDEAAGADRSPLTASDEATDSTNSDNVFDDEETSCSLERDDWSSAVKHSISVNSVRTGTNESPLIPKPLETNTRTNPVHAEYARAINSITAKLGAATSVTLPTFNSGATLATEDSRTESSNQNIDEPRDESIMPNAQGESGSGKTNATTIHDLSKEPPSPNRFLFQPCSPNIMGRLSASTLRGKIQNLPLYLTRSQETLNQAGVRDVSHGVAEDTEITIKLTDVHDVTQTLDFETDIAAESVESDDSDSTITGSEDFFVDTTTTHCSTSERMTVDHGHPSLPVQTEPKPQHRHRPLYAEHTPGPITEPPVSILSSLQRGSTGLDMDMDTPGPGRDTPESSPVEDFPDNKTFNKSPHISSPLVVTTQNLNGPFLRQSQNVRRTSSDRPLTGLCGPTERNADASHTLSSGCKMFTICEDPSQTKTTAQPLRPEIGCTSVLASGCESVVEGAQMPLDACGCPAVYTNCFSGDSSFDEELTVYEFSCRSSGANSGTVLPLLTTPPAPSFLSASTNHSPSFPRSILFSSSTSELSPLLSPLSEASDSFFSQTNKDTISRLGQQRYPEPPGGFQVVRVDVDQLLCILESSSADRSVEGHGGRHPRDTCPAHFTENKRVLQIEARRLMTGCQKVVGVGQSPEEMLHSLADSFRTLVELAGICLWFSGCDRCDKRNAEAVAGLADVARSFRDFCLAAERASSKRSCQDLSTKLLAKQCTALTASVFCLTQLFRTLTVL